MNRIFSGIQPTGALHLGNYLGALKRFPTYQDDYECVYCIVDLHAVTQDIAPADLRRNIITTAAAMLAAGIDPNKSVLFVQSMNPHHAEMMQVLSAVARVGQLDRMHHFRDKTGDDAARARVGLYSYPVLMAADILAYSAGYVPVASDQQQHLNFCRDVAKSFNSIYGEVLTQPQGLISNVKVMSLQDGTSKMSKSDQSDRTRINLDDSDEEIRRKFRKAKAEVDRLPASREDMLGDDGKEIRRPEAYNLLSIYAALENIDFAESIRKFAGCGFGDLKDALADSAIREIAPLRAKIAKLTAMPDALYGILADGARRARKMSGLVVPTAQHAIGLGHD